MSHEQRFQAFRRRLEQEVLRHPAITANTYTRWFRRGVATPDQARAFMVQFSVFSNEFLFAQLRKMVNANTLDEMRASKEILANEIGVGFRDPSRQAAATPLGDPVGTVEGGRFRFRAAHFELLARMAAQLGLEFHELGKRRYGTPSTLHFCDELLRLYGSEDHATANAASWAVENWAAAGFWDELVEGWRGYREAQDMPHLNLGFFTWHARLEANHAQHTWDELEALYRSADIHEDAFIALANEMLDGVRVFWDGLDQQRRRLGASAAARVPGASAAAIAAGLEH